MHAEIKHKCAFKEIFYNKRGVKVLYLGCKHARKNTRSEGKMEEEKSMSTYFSSHPEIWGHYLFINSSFSANLIQGLFKERRPPLSRSEKKKSSLAPSPNKRLSPPSPPPVLFTWANTLITRPMWTHDMIFISRAGAASLSAQNDTPNPDNVSRQISI